MFCRYVINKINHRTNCYQGILVTLGTMMHNGELSSSLKSEVESIFEILNRELPTPPEMETETFRNSLSWFKKDSRQFASCSEQMKRAAQILLKLNHEILMLEADQLQNVLFEDSDQVVVQAGSNRFSILPATF